jgi:hypothetical protein
VDVRGRPGPAVPATPAPPAAPAPGPGHLGDLAHPADAPLIVALRIDARQIALDPQTGRALAPLEDTSAARPTDTSARRIGAAPGRDSAMVHHVTEAQNPGLAHSRRSLTV